VANTLAASRVSGPAIALIVTGAIGLPLSVLGMLGNLFGLAAGGMRQPDIMPMMLPAGIQAVASFIAIAISIVIIIGALKMKNLENYTFAMTASIMAMVPCISPCCWLGLPFGIWALVVLNDANVKAAFRS